MEKAVYKCGVMSQVWYVEGPDGDDGAAAAAMFSAAQRVAGSGQVWVVIYEKNGRPYEGNSAPFGEWMLGGGGTPEELDKYLENLTPLVLHCRMLDEAEAVAAGN